MFGNHCTDIVTSRGNRTQAAVPAPTTMSATFQKDTSGSTGLSLAFSLAFTQKGVLTGLMDWQWFQQ